LQHHPNQGDTLSHAALVLACTPQDAQIIERALGRMVRGEQELKLLESYRAWSLSPAERAIYDRNRVPLRPDLEPVTQGERILATVFVAVVVAAALAYTCYHSLRRGYVTNRTCFVTFLVGVAYEVAVAGSVSAALWHAYLPALLVHKLGLNLSLAFTGPFR
jgi:hypothetical protein